MEEEPRTLLIRRVDRSGDPWSGQVAFPGGKREQSDASFRATAEREAMEEVGISLAEGGRFEGYGGMLRTHTGEMDVVPAVFSLTGAVPVVTNREVASYRWVEWKTLSSPEAAARYRMESGGRPVDLPAISIGDYVVWGLTHRIISSLLG